MEALYHMTLTPGVDALDAARSTQLALKLDCNEPTVRIQLERRCDSTPNDGSTSSTNQSVVRHDLVNLVEGSL